MRSFIAAVIALCCAACATTRSDMVLLSLGMTKREVVEALGKPDSVQTDKDLQILNYELKESVFSSDWTRETYLVVLQNGKLITFGHEDNYMGKKELAEKYQRRREAVQLMMEFQAAQPPIPAFTPAPQPIQTNCTSQKRFGTVYTDCTSQ